MIQGSNPSKDKKFISSPKCPNGCGAQEGGVLNDRREANHSMSSFCPGKE